VRDRAFTATSEQAARLKNELFERATRLGFVRCGVARAGNIERSAALNRWLANGFDGEMGYMRQTAEQRANPESILPGAASAIVVAASYACPADEARRLECADDPGVGLVARYARGADYHGVLRVRLEALAAWLGEQVGCQTRVAVDTAPLLERELAMAAGIGFIGKNTMLISPGVGSYTSLGVLLTTAALPACQPAEARCGHCRRCLDSCPTNAFAAPYLLDARRCISYLTIEHRRDIAPELAQRSKRWVFGCDECQQVCPYNKPTRHSRQQPVDEDLAPLDGLSELSLEKLLSLKSGAYRRLVKGRALARVPRHCLVRNAAVAAANTQAQAVEADDALGAALAKAKDGAREEVADTINAALGRWQARRRDG
jgi:epoxyqueuosine reductase